MPQPNRQDVTAAIVNYGNSRDTLELAGKLVAEVSRIIVVDNGGDIDPANPVFRQTDIISPGENIGFGAAINRAAAMASTRWLLILNPDVRLKRNCLKHLVEASRHLHAPLCGPRFYWDEACTLQLPPALGHPLWLLSDRHIPNRDLTETPDISALAVARHEHFWKEQAPFTEPVLSGACMLADIQWFRDNHIPLFDAAFFLYYEDTDLCARLMRKGVMPVCVADARAVHFWNQSAEPPEGKAALMQASEKIFLQKYYPNGAPPLPPSAPLPACTELGTVRTAPGISLPADTFALDIGVQEDFMVFVRAHPAQPVFTFSHSLWKRIRAGSYFMRASDARGKPLQYWRWTKT